MVASGLTPRDPARWYLAFAIERAIAEEERDDAH